MRNDADYEPSRAGVNLPFVNVVKTTALSDSRTTIACTRAELSSDPAAMVVRRACASAGIDRTAARRRDPLCGGLHHERVTHYKSTSPQISRSVVEKMLVPYFGHFQAMFFFHFGDSATETHILSRRDSSNCSHLFTFD